MAQPLFEGVVLMVAIGLGAIRILANRNRLELLSAQETARSDPGRPLIRGLDNSVLVALGAIVVVLLIGSYYLPAFLSPAICCCNCGSRRFSALWPPGRWW